MNKSESTFRAWEEFGVIYSYALKIIMHSTHSP